MIRNPSAGSAGSVRMMISNLLVKFRIVDLPDRIRARVSYFILCVCAGGPNCSGGVFCVVSCLACLVLLFVAPCVLPSCAFAERLVVFVFNTGGGGSFCMALRRVPGNVVLGRRSKIFLITLYFFFSVIFLQIILNDASGIWYSFASFYAMLLDLYFLILSMSMS